MMGEWLVAYASVIVKWLYPEADSNHALDVYANQKYRFMAPDFAKAEMANAIWKKVRMKELSYDRGEALLRNSPSHFLVEWLPFEGYLARAFALARLLTHNAIYDCIYFAIAEQRKAKLLSADTIFLKRAEEKGFSNLILPLSQASAR